MVNREEIEAAAARAGVRITDSHESPEPGDVLYVACVGPRYQVRAYGPTRAWAFFGYDAELTRGPGTLDEAFSAIAADIDENASVRVESTAELSPCRDCGEPTDRAPVGATCAECLTAATKELYDTAIAPAHDRADAQGYARCTADVVAWVVEYRKTCEFPDVRGIRDAIRTNAHVGAAGDE